MSGVAQGPREGNNGSLGGHFKIDYGSWGEAFSGDGSRWDASSFVTALFSAWHWGDTRIDGGKKWDGFRSCRAVKRPSQHWMQSL